MGVEARYGKEAESAINQGFRNRQELIPLYNKERKERSQRYLRFWGNDYLYLNGDKNNEQRWLPVPENSEVQHFIRNLNRTLQFE